MTTTRRGGEIDLTAPAPVLEGDDIEVIPDAPHPPGRGRVRAILVGAIVVVLAAAGITVALVTRDDGTGRVSSTAPRVRPVTSRPIAKHPTPAKTSAPKVTVAKFTPTSAVAITPATPPPATPPESTPTTVAVMPSSVLTWQSTPAELTLKAGAHATLAVTVTNPSAGTVTLGLPLSCPPVLQTDAGAPIGSGAMRAQMAQVMAPHQTLTQQYTIYATDTGDASGQPLAAGRYLVRVEGLKSFRVTVT